MRSIYYMVMAVRRSSSFNMYHEINNPKAYIFVKDHDPYSAWLKASFYTEKIGWDIEYPLLPPVVVEEQSFADPEFFSGHIRGAEREGLAFLLKGESDFYKSGVAIDMINEKPGDPSFYHKALKEEKKRKVCLHYDSGETCDSVIKAHSIQKSRSLKSISKKGHVYRMGEKIEDGGVLRFKKQGVEKASTFYGFCKKHDNDLFEEIDNYNYQYCSKQTALYAYRSICREVYVKQNSLTLSEKMIGYVRNRGEALEGFVRAWNLGTENGVKNILSAKQLFDQALREGRYSNIEYVAFSFLGKPSIHFSGLMYPEYDFNGSMLQNLADLETELSLVTFCSAPTDEGWAFVFSWHQNHASIGRTFLSSLANFHHSGGKLEDALFRLAISGCENFALAPDWWEGLSPEVRDEIEWRFAHVGGPMSAPDPQYLVKGLEGIVSWECESVRSSF